MTSTATLETDLRSAVPDCFIHAGTGGVAVQGLEPCLVVQPRTQVEVGAILAIANRVGAAVVPWGNGRRQYLGAPPARYDLALNLSSLTQIVEYEPADLTVTVEAGITLRTLQERLAEHGQWLPLDPPLAGFDTIGGILATNASGPARVAHGAARDLVIGMTVSTAPGEIVKSGGRVVKNVAGYDLAKLHIGAFGTLGVITQATFKVAPKPSSSAFLAGSATAPESAIGFVQAVARVGLAATGLGIIGIGSTCSPVVRLAGSSAAVGRSLQECHAIAARFGNELSQKESDPWPSLAGSTRPHGASQVILRCVLEGPKMLPAAVEVMKAGARILAYPTVGSLYAVWQSPSEAVEEAIAGLRAAIGANEAIVIEAAPPEFKQRVDVWGPPRADFALMRRLKDEMDPNHILNPGRFVGGI